MGEEPIGDALLMVAAALARVDANAAERIGTAVREAARARPADAAAMVDWLARLEAVMILTEPPAPISPAPPLH